jgi:ribosomal protein S6--L-glutamate ligase
MEINSTPGLEGIETASKKNIAQAIITYIERNRNL